MGKENTENFQHQIEPFIESLPEQLSFLDRYNNCIDLIKNVATIYP